MTKEKLIGALKYAGVSLLAIALICYIGYHIFNNFSGSVETVVASELTLYETVEYDAYIMRSERILYSSSSGGTDALVSDGEKVRSGEAVAGIYTSESADVRFRIAEIDARLELLESVSSSYGSSVLDTGKLDKSIETVLTDLKFQTERGDFSYAADIRAKLVSLIGRRGVITDTTRDVGADIAALEAQRTALASKMTGALSTVYAPEAGYYYSEPDGYEEIFSASLVDTMTLATFDEMCAAQPDASLTGSSAAGKLVTDYIWYAAVRVDSSVLRGLTTGESYPVSFKYNGDVTVSITLYRVCESSDGARALLIFQSEDMPDGFKYTRVQPAALALTSYTGCRVPLSALRIVNGYQGVYILSGKTVHFRRADVLLESEGYALIAGREDDDTEPTVDLNGDGSIDGKDVYDWLEVNDLVITAGKNLYEGRIVENN